MGIDCGSQCVLCDVPIRFDTYKGCSHDCKYCFARKKQDISKLAAINCLGSLKNFIEGKRNFRTNWCDWDIPLHWGGMSDPFQPVEEKYRISYEALKIFAETKYPFIVSTKGRLVAAADYLELIKQCNACVQVSMVSPKFDKYELGAPTYKERLAMLPQLAYNSKRLIVRAQPYVPEALQDILNKIPQYADSGVYGIVLEGLKTTKKVNGMVKVAGDYCYDRKLLENHFNQIKNACHKHGLSFFSGENRLRKMGDSFCCCGVEGLEGFKPNKYNLSHLYNGDKVIPTEKMKEKGTAFAFQSLDQSAGVSSYLRQESFASLMAKYFKEQKYYGELN